MLLGLEDEFAVLQVERLGPDTDRVVMEVTNREGACPGCGVPTSRIEEHPLGAGIMAQCAVLICAADFAHAPGATVADTEACDEHAEELVGQDAVLVAYGLTPRHLATWVRADEIPNGPIVDAREIVAGFYIVEAPDLDAALAMPVAGRPASTAPARQSRVADQAGACLLGLTSLPSP